MLRFVARFLGIWAVAGGLVMAVVDGAKSIAASAVVITPLADTWARLGGSEPAAAAWPLDAGVEWLMQAPTAALLGGLGFLLLALGRRRRRDLAGAEFAT